MTISSTISYEETSKTYAAGIEARRFNKPKTIPFPVNSNRDICLKYWWLAGWNDADIELKKPDDLE